MRKVIREQYLHCPTTATKTKTETQENAIVGCIHKSEEMRGVVQVFGVDGSSKLMDPA